MPCAGVPARPPQHPIPAFPSYPCPSAHTPPRLPVLVPLSQPFIQHWGPPAETLTSESESSPALHYCSAEERTSFYPEGIIFFPESRCIMHLGSPQAAQPLLPARARTSGKVSSQPDFSISVRNDVFATKRKKKKSNSGSFHAKHRAIVTHNFSCSPGLQDKLPPACISPWQCDFREPRPNLMPRGCNGARKAVISWRVTAGKPQSTHPPGCIQGVLGICVVMPPPAAGRGAPAHGWPCPPSQA